MKKIAVIGSVNMDMAATAERIPRKGETVSADALSYLPGGKGANQAVAAARLGAETSFFGCVGDDAFGGRLVEELRRNGVNTDNVRALPGVPSGLAMIIVAEKDNAITVVPGANACVTREYLDEVWPELERAEIILLQNEIPADTVLYASQRLYKEGKTVVYNPAPARPESRLLVDSVTYLTPNEHEARLLMPREERLEELVMKNPRRLIVTLGSRGVLASEDGSLLSVPGYRANVVDTTGAGDTFNGAFAYALSVRMGFEDALAFANAAASLSVERSGAQEGMPSLTAVKERLRQKPA